MAGQRVFLNGKWYTDDPSPVQVGDLNIGGTGNRNNFIPMVSDFVTVAGSVGTSASSATSAAAAAASSASAASSSASSASTSASNAATSASTATTKATQATNSATAAATSATQAATSATNAAASAANPQPLSAANLLTSFSNLSSTQPVAVASGYSFLGGKNILKTFSGRSSTFLLFQYSTAYTSSLDAEAIDFDVYDSSDYDVYSAINVIIDRVGNGVAKCWGQRTVASGFNVNIKTYVNGTTVSVYAVTDNYVDYFTITAKYNRTTTPLLGTYVGTDAYVPGGTLVFSSMSASTQYSEGTPSNPVTLTLKGGMVGINNNSPTQALDITGNIKLSGFFQNGSCTTGTRPTVGISNGTQIYDTTINKLIVREAGVWVKYTSTAA